MLEQDNELSYWEKQLIKYTKGHYDRIDYNKDLKHFPSAAYWIGLDQVEKYHTLGMIVRLHEKLVKRGDLTFKLESFIDNIYRRSRMERSDYENVNREDIMRQLLAEIQNMAVQGRGMDLGEADEKLFSVISDNIEKEKGNNNSYQED
jgi:Mg2+ and Co2+ transporter CorA